MKKALSYLLIFIGLQIVGGGIITILWNVIAGNSDETAAKLITTTAVVGIITIVIFLWTRYAEVMWIQEQMPELPNFAEQAFDTILGTPWGYFVIGLLAPLSEEIVMRGAILKELLKSEKLPVWASITISAVMFSVILMNPAQMPHAFLIGLLLGWMYWRTGSILPGVAYHWANNSIAFVMFAFYPDPDMKLIDLFKGSELHVYMALGFSLLILLPAIFQLNLWMRRAE